MGFALEYAEDGVEAVDKCMLKKYALVVMDNMMPNMTGKEATMTLRKQGYHGLIVGLTGNILDEDLEEFRESGCDEVITKPLDVPELRRTLISLGLNVQKKETSHSSDE
jgi:CheY-like chemotaxis protein